MIWSDIRGWEYANSVWRPISVDDQGRLAVMIAGLAPGTVISTTLSGLLVLGAGENHVGETSGRINKVSIGFVGHAGTGGYTINTTVGALGTLPGLMRVAGGQAYITEIRLTTNKKSITPRFRIDFFNASTVTIAADNASWKDLYADTSKRAGYVDMPAMTTAADTVNSDMSRSVLALTPFKPLVAAPGDTAMYVALECLDAFTPATYQQFTLVVVAEVY